MYTNVEKREKESEDHALYDEILENSRKQGGKKRHVSDKVEKSFAPYRWKT